MKDTMINNSTRSHIRQIQKAMRQNRLVVLVGAGASATCGVPSWSDLIEELKKELDLPEYETDFLKIPQLYKNMRKHKEYHERIKEILQDGQVQSSYIQDEILNLNPCHIITTNYDNLIEQAIVKSRDNYFVVRRDEDLPCNRGERMLLKMHGDFSADNIVLTEDDYLDYARNFPLMRSYVMSLFASKLVLLIGFSYSDINLKYILRDVKQCLGDKMQPVYMLASDSMNSHIQTYFDSNYIQVVTIPDSVAKGALNAQHVEFESAPFNNEKSNTLYHQLLLLQKYSEQCNDFVSQIVNFLFDYGDQFSTIGSYIRYIFPPEYRREIRIQYGELVLPRVYKESLSRIMSDDDAGKAYRKEYGEDLDKVMLWLNQNDVHKVAETSIDLDEFVKNIDFNNEQVHPMKMFYTMDITNLSVWIESQKNRPLAYGKEDMIYPYMLCVTGHYNDAYERYKYLADVMLAKRKYVLYFLCLYNIRALYGPVMNEMFGSSLEAWKRVNKELSKIDLNDVVSRLPIEGAIKKILSDLQNGNYLFSQLIDSEKFCNLLREQREQSERGGASLNSSIHHIIHSFNEITDFQINNYIYNEPFEYFKTTNLKIAEGILHSLLTLEGKHEFGNTRLSKLYGDLEYLFVFGLTPEELKKLLHRVVGERKIAFDESFQLAIEGVLNNIHADLEKNENHGDYISKKVIGKVIINVMWISLYTDTKLNLPHIYELIAAYWIQGEIFLQDKLLNRFTYTYSASGADSVLVMDKLIHCQLHIMERLQPAIANLCFYIKEEGLYVKELISVKQIESSENVEFIASFCKGAEHGVKAEIVKCLQDKVKCLYHLTEAEFLSGERIINEELLRKFKEVISSGYINNLYKEEHVCASLVQIVSLPEYSDVKDVIEEIMEGNECYKFLKDPINYRGSLSEVPGQCFYYISDEHFKELLNKSEVRKLIKEFCDKTAWSDDLRERMWKLL